MFSWVCPRCGHDVPPSKTECPFCSPPAPEPVPAPAQQYWAPQMVPPPQQYQPQPPPQQAPQQAPPPYAAPAPPQYGQQAPPQYWQPQQPPPPQQYPPQVPQPLYAQQAPPQYWQPQPPPPQYPPQQYQPQQYPPAPEPPPQQYYPPAPPPQEPPPPQYQPVPQQYTPPAPVVAEYRQPEPPPAPLAPTAWPPPEEQTGMSAAVKGAIAFFSVLAVFALAYFFLGSHGSSSAKDISKQQTTNPLQKYIEVVGIRLVSDKAGQAVKFLVVNHSGVEMTDLSANVTLWASTQRSEEDSVGSFTFHVDSLAPNESKEVSAPLKTDKAPSDMPEDWRNVTADVQVTSQ